MSSPGVHMLKGNKLPGQWSMRATSATRRKMRRSYRKHAAKMFAAGCPEKAAVWLKRARNG